MHKYLFVTGVLLFGISGCAPTLQDQLDNYAYRLDNTLPKTSEKKPDASLFLGYLPLAGYRLPPPKELSLPWPDTPLSLWEALKMSRCSALLPLAQKNTTLGKFQQGSQKLVLESKLLIHLPNCIDQLKNTQPELANKLTAALQQKRRHKQQMVWNALFSGSEFQRYASLSQGDLALDNKVADSNGVQALAYWQLIMSNIIDDKQLDSSLLEQHMKQLLFNPLLGQWINSTHKTIATLDNTSFRIEANASICSKPISEASRQRIQRVFKLFYADEMQPWIARLIRIGQALESHLISLVNHIPKSAQQAAGYRTLTDYLDRLFGNQGLNKKLQASISRQVHAWQSLLANCRLMPRQP